MTDSDSDSYSHSDSDSESEDESSSSGYWWESDSEEEEETVDYCSLGGEAIEDVFMDVDWDHSGDLSCKEIYYMWDDYCPYKCKWDIVELCMSYDVNDNGVIDEEEFPAFFEDSEEDDEDGDDDDGHGDFCVPAGDATECGMIFNAADADCSGALTGTEILDFLDDPTWGND